MSACRTAWVAAFSVVLAGCGSEQTASEDAAPSAGTGGGTLVVLAAASLTETFTALELEYETTYPSVDVVLSFGASSALAEQVVSGAPADVFAAASTATMRTAQDAGAIEATPTVFASNTLEIVVPPDNPGDVATLSDLADPGLTLALCAPQVPCGAAAEKVFAAADLTVTPDTFEQDVKATMTKVVLGEVDAALVYRTDAAAAGDTVRSIEFPEASQAVNDYPIAALADAPHPAAAQAWIDMVTSLQGQQILSSAGFQVPDGNGG